MLFAEKKATVAFPLASVYQASYKPSISNSIGTYGLYVMFKCVFFRNT